MDGNHKDVWMWIGGGIVAAIGWLVKRINNRIDRAHDRIEKLDNEKLEKDVFEEFRKSNDESHERFGKQLDRIEGKLDGR